MKKLLLIFCLTLTANAFTQTANSFAPKEWTFMVYLNGDNDLDSAAGTDLNEMKAVGSSLDVNILVLRDFGAKESSKIFYIEKGKSTTVFDYKKNIDTGDFNSLIEFFRFAKTNYPAERYLIDIWNHGNGWMNFAPEIFKRGISYDDTTGNHISTAQLGLAMQKIKEINSGKNIDILGTDACLMAMGEVIHEISGSVDYLIASQETEPDAGWDYKSTLKILVNSPMQTTEDFIRAHVKAYVDSYYNYGSSVTQSAINVSKFDEVLPLVTEYANYALSLVPTKKLAFQSARAQTQGYAVSSYKDFIDFLTKANAKVADSKLTALGNQLIKAINDSVVANEENAYPNSHGISIWIPTDTSKFEEYLGLKWSKDTAWPNFIKAIIK